VDGRAILEADLASKQVSIASSAAPEALAEAMRDAGFDVDAA
jgi:hypothetical protein